MHSCKKKKGKKKRQKHNGGRGEERKVKAKKKSLYGRSRIIFFHRIFYHYCIAAHARNTLRIVERIRGSRNERSCNLFKGRGFELMVTESQTCPSPIIFFVICQFAFPRRRRRRKKNLVKYLVRKGFPKSLRTFDARLFKGLGLQLRCDRKVIARARPRRRFVTIFCFICRIVILL